MTRCARIADRVASQMSINACMHTFVVESLLYCQCAELALEILAKAEQRYAIFAEAEPCILSSGEQQRLVRFDLCCAGAVS